MKKEQTSVPLNPDQKSQLLSSVLCYLHSNAFDKPLKKLISSAHIQDDNWKACPVNLEDMFKHYLETCSNADAKLDSSKVEEPLSNGTKKGGEDNSSEEASKKKRKGEDTKSPAAVADNVEAKTKKKTKKASDPVEHTEQLSEQATKEQKQTKKKNKHKSEPLESNIDSKEEVKSKDKKKKSESRAKSDGNSEADPDVKEKSKEKKKKKKKKDKIPVSNAENANIPLDQDTHLSKTEKREEEDLASEKLSNGVTEVTNKEDVGEKKETKKRKRSDLDENDMGTPLTNGKNEIKGEESTGHKSRGKDINGSKEPKSVNAFQRVKVEEVKFADERLQDNSYWAKDGADIGYGAKAQEVLGQVKGRDFRHEKTKKKRGSYRGGVIDLHSHSVKFNYEDED